MTARLYWVGNAAKSRVMAEVLADGRSSCRVFDYGAGRGGDWPEILAAHPAIDLVCYEPDPESDRDLRAKLAGTRARVLSEAEFQSASIEADYIVSFSVLEHVFDKPAYMRHAKRHLAPTGVFHLNYDDGHFRTSLDLDELRGWRTGLAVTAQNRLAWLWPRLNRVDRYQARVPAAEIMRLVGEAGFSIASDRYDNLGSFKSLAKTVPAGQAQEFMRFWLATEDELNRRFRFTAEPRMGDDVNLWREMASRTLALRHA